MNEVSTEVVQPDDSQSQSALLISQILAVVKDPDVDAQKVESVAKLATGLQDREREAEFNRSMHAAISEMPVITRDGAIKIVKNNITRIQGRFARYEDLDRVCRPILLRNGLSIAFEIGEDERGQAVTVRPIVRHNNGFTYRGEAMRVPQDTSGSKNAAQASGSSQSYGKRYAYIATFNIITEGADDDGNQGAMLSLPHERETTVLDEAEAAAKEGRYLDWFQQQGPKDRAWLVANGHHERFGGQPLPQIAAKKSAPKAEQEQEQEQAPEPKPEKPRMSAKEWVEQYKRQVDETNGVEDLIELQKVNQSALDRLKTVDKELYDSAVKHNSDRYAQLEGRDEGRLV